MPWLPSLPATPEGVVAHPVGLSEQGLAVARLSAGVVVRLLAEEVHQVVAGARILAVVAVEGPRQTR